MTNIFLVGIGGFIGSVMRYLVGNYFHHPGRDFPLGTLIVNVAGCFVIGFLSHVAEGYGLGSGSRSFVFVGVLGGFTTFSSFGNETLKLARDNQILNASANVGANVVLGLFAVWLGHTLAALIWRP